MSRARVESVSKFHERPLRPEFEVVLVAVLHDLFSVVFPILLKPFPCLFGQLFVSGLSDALVYDLEHLRDQQLDVTRPLGLLASVHTVSFVKALDGLIARQKPELS